MQATRERILKILQERRQATVDELSRELGLTSATIRHHLDTLQSEGLVEMPDLVRRSTPGRPQYLFKLTDAAAQHFPKKYAELAEMLFAELEERLAPDELERVLRRMAGQIVAEFPSIPDEDFDSRVNRAVQFLNDKGYMARCTKSDAEYILQVSNCLYRDVAQAHAQLCKLDRELVARLVQVTPHHHSRMGEGEAVCLYRFSAPAGSSVPRPEI